MTITGLVRFFISCESAYMQVPKRRSEQNIKRESGPFLITSDGLEKLKRLQLSLEKQLPFMISEVERTKAHGDFSENAAYQDAKHTLRRTHARIETIKDRIKRADIIKKEPNTTGRVQVGSTVVLETGGKRFTFEILGSHESNPSQGRISDRSPLGQVLMGQAVGDEVILELKTGTVHYKIMEIR